LGQRIKRWQDGYLVELARCPCAAAHTTGGPGGAAVMIRASGAFDFTCLTRTAVTATGGRFAPDGGPGMSRVRAEFRFMPKIFVNGAIVSGIGLLLLPIGFVVVRRGDI